MKKFTLLSTLVCVLLASTLINAVSCARPSGVDDSVVQIWQPSAESGEPETLLAFGVVVEDGKHVLTVLDYEEYTPDGLLVVSPKYGQFEAIVQAVDYRTSATLLELQDAYLPVAEIGGSLPLESQQQVYARGWGGCNDEYIKTPLTAYCTENISPIFFSVSLPQEILGSGQGVVGEVGSVITDGNGKVIGLLGRYWSKLLIHLGGPLDQYPSRAVSIESALELLTDPSHTSGPAVAVVLTEFSSNDIVPSMPPHQPINAIENLDSAITELLDKLGEPLPFDDLPEYYLGLPMHFHPEPEEGVVLAAAFTYPVELHSSGGSLLAKAKWVGIQWNRSEDKPDRLLYGSTAYIIEGAYSIEGDMGNLIQILQPVLQKVG